MFVRSSFKPSRTTASLRRARPTPTPKCLLVANSTTLVKPGEGRVDGWMLSGACTATNRRPRRCFLSRKPPRPSGLDGSAAFCFFFWQVTRISECFVAGFWPCPSFKVDVLVWGGSGRCTHSYVNFLLSFLQRVDQFLEESPKISTPKDASSLATVLFPKKPSPVNHAPSQASASVAEAHGTGAFCEANEASGTGRRAAGLRLPASARRLRPSRRLDSWEIAVRTVRGGDAGVTESRILTRVRLVGIVGWAKSCFCWGIHFVHVCFFVADKTAKPWKFKDKFKSLT